MPVCRDYPAARGVQGHTVMTFAAEQAAYVTFGFLRSLYGAKYRAPKNHSSRYPHDAMRFPALRHDSITTHDALLMGPWRGCCILHIDIMRFSSHCLRALCPAPLQLPARQRRRHVVRGGQAWAAASHPPPARLGRGGGRKHACRHPRFGTHPLHTPALFTHTREAGACVSGRAVCPAPVPGRAVRATPPCHRHPC